MNIVRLVTRWQRVGQRNLLQVAVDHADAGVAWTDITGQPDANITPAPNAVTIEAVPVSDALLTALQADANVEVLWSEPYGS
jgi:hypothetical protein